MHAYQLLSCYEAKAIFIRNTKEKKTKDDTKSIRQYTNQIIRKCQTN